MSHECTKLFAAAIATGCIVFGAWRAFQGPTEAPPIVVRSVRFVTVRAGETLSGIARRELGSAARWVDLARANHIDDPCQLPAGALLEVPTR